MKPNEYIYEDIAIGMNACFTVTVTPEQMAMFRDMSGDVNPLHNDEAYAKSLGYPDRVSFGMLSASFLSTLAGVYIPGKYSIIHSVDVSFPKPVIVGDQLSISGTVIEKNEVYRYFIMQVSITNQRNEKVCRGKMQIGVAK